MSDLDRSRLAGILKQLGDEKDESVLAAAREASRMVAEAGLSWDALLDIRPTEAAEEADPVAEAAPSPAGEQSSESRIIERLLSRKDISDTLRGDLMDFKKQIAEGTLDKMDADYIRALAKRLS